MPNNPTEIIRLLLENIAPIAVLILIFTFKPFILPKLYALGFRVTLNLGIRAVKENPTLFTEQFIHKNVANKEGLVRDFQKFQTVKSVKKINSPTPNQPNPTQDPQTRSYEAEIMTLDGVLHKYIFQVINTKKAFNNTYSFQEKIRNIQQIA